MAETVVNPQPAMGNESAPAMDAIKPAETKPAATTDSLQSELETVRKALKDANKEAEARRKKLDEYEAKEREAETAKLSEMEKLQKALDAEKKAKEAALRTENDRLIKSEILSKADKFIDADAVYALVDKSKITVKDDGTIEGATEALAELENSKPHLLKHKPVAKPGATNPGVNGSISETWAQKKERLTGQSSSMFSAGGGVVWPPSQD